MMSSQDITQIPSIIRQEIAVFQEHISALRRSLELEEDDIARQETEDEIKEYEGKISILISESISSDLRGSKRISVPAEKARDLKENEKAKRESILSSEYEKWLVEAKETRKNLKTFCNSEELKNLTEKIEKSRDKVIQAYDHLRTIATPSEQSRRLVDTVTELSRSIIKVIASKNTQGAYDDTRERARVRSELCKETHPSIFGSSESVITSIRSGSTISRTASERAKAAAEVAVSQAEVKALKELEVKRAKLAQIEAEAKKQESELKILEAEFKERVARVRLQAYNENSIDEDTDCIFEKFEPKLPQSSRQEENVQRNQCSHNIGMNVNAPSFVPLFRPDQDRQENSIRSVDNTPSSPMQYASLDAGQLVKALTESIALNRLPVPEPVVFKGDPLQYTDWKASFRALIEGKNIAPADKLFYLRRYVGEPVIKALESYFMVNTAEAYELAWKVLEERYGDPHTLSAAFLQKLHSWPNISKDGTGLRDFSDFLRSCQTAMTHIPDLEVLNSVMENQKLLRKLPENIAVRWKRDVTKKQATTGCFPNFAEFVQFLEWEAKIICNPVFNTATHRPSEKFQTQRDDRHRGKASSLVTASSDDNNGKDNAIIAFSRTEKKDTVKETSSRQAKLLCVFCGQPNHSLTKCNSFVSKTMEEKRKFIQENKLCFGCLKEGHFTKDCRFKHTCGKCKKRHPTCLHDDSYTKQPSFQPRKTNRTSSNLSETQQIISHRVGRNTSMTSTIVPVWVSSSLQPEKEILTYALLDTQSDTTFILKDLGSDLKVKSQPVKLKLSTMTSTNETIASERFQGLQVRGFNSTHRLSLPVTYSREFIPVDRSHIPTDDTTRNWPHLQPLIDKIPPLQSCDVGLLIGYDCPYALAPQDSILGRENEPFAQRTELGWSIVGYSTRSNTNMNSLSHRVSVKEMPPVTPQDVITVLESDFKTEAKGDRMISQEDIQFLKIMENGIRQGTGQHYEMPLPFRGQSQPTLPDNKGMCLVRLKHLKRKFVRDPKYFSDYKKFMDDIINKGDAEEAVGDGSIRNKWYIPHHGVYHPKKPGKIRVVFDCSAKAQGTSLNDHLLTGPDLNNCLIGVLLRFRSQPTAIMCDIERMFHQFQVHKSDRDYLRFLWWKDGDTGLEPTEFRMTVHLFGAASSPSCANYGLKYIAKEHGKDKPLASDFIQRSFYVDDGLTSTETTEEAIKLVQDARDICQQGGLRLHKFISNDRNVLESIPISERASGVQDVNLNYEELPMERALGVQWHVETDVFKFKVHLQGLPPTRRGILSTVASIYDPLGILAPFVLTGKSILQDLCQEGISWDDPLPANVLPRWENWKKDLTALEGISIQRCYKPKNFGKVNIVELHHFSDASTSGYGQCSYIRFVSDTQVHCALITGKARVAPKRKMVTIPRLELTAAVVSVKVSALLKEELEYKVDREYFWTDSKVVLGYINNEARRFHVFVANRVTRIKQGSKSSQWNYIPTDQNPADHASRGLHVAALMQSNWFGGPQFLWEREIITSDKPSTELDVNDPEVRVSNLCSFLVEQGSDVLDRFERFSSWSAVLRAVARILRLANRNTRTGITTVEERRQAEASIIKLVQRKAFTKEMKELEMSSGKLTRRHDLFSLNPFIQDEILRVGGRLKKSSEPNAFKHPVILPRDSHITTLIITHFHERVHHQGRGITLNEIRVNGYWIIGGSKAVAKHIYRCFHCRKLRRPVEEQKMADLPEDRTEPSPPFTYTGMDCFGPFQTRQGRKVNKRYGLLFTCLSSRAVHIEMIDDMSTDTFINALRCFLSLRGTVRYLRSDQGTNFVGARNEFQRALKEINFERLQMYLAEKQCQFLMNTPCSSHAGGVWERQIRTIKSILTSIIQQHFGRLDDSSLRTFLYEAMAIVNNRPLSTDTINDPSGLSPLTPNHLLTMKSTVPLPPPGNFVRKDIYLRKRWRRVQYLAEQFWSRWKREYLINKIRRQKWLTPRRNLAVGDIVIVKDDNTPRNEWQLAKVAETIPSEDGLVRKVRIQIGDGKLDQNGKRIYKSSIIERPVQKLVLLIEA